MSAWPAHLAFTEGEPVEYRPVTGGCFAGICQGLTKSGLVKIQIAEPLWFVRTKASRVQHREAELVERYKL